MKGIKASILLWNAFLCAMWQDRDFKFHTGYLISLQRYSEIRGYLETLRLRNREQFIAALQVASDRERFNQFVQENIHGNYNCHMLEDIRQSFLATYLLKRGPFRFYYDFYEPVGEKRLARESSTEF